MSSKREIRRAANAQMERANREYYAKKGKRIYSDFSTFAQGKALALANSIEFLQKFARRKSKIVVCEYGVGGGNFAKEFLENIAKLSPRTYNNIEYWLFDYSEKMLSDAKKSLKKHAAKCRFQAFDAIKEKPFLEFDYCRMNELLSDLPVEVYANDRRKPQHEDPAVGAFLSRLGFGIKIPFPFAAEKFLLGLCSAGKKGFLIEAFDYGFHSFDDICSLPKKEWNRLVIREYGGQITSDLNFLYLSAALKANGYAVEIEPQKNYCERLLKAGLESVHTERGLDYRKKTKKSRFSEHDGFYRLAIWEKY